MGKKSVSWFFIGTLFFFCLIATGCEAVLKREQPRSAHLNPDLTQRDSILHINDAGAETSDTYQTNDSSIIPKEDRTIISDQGQTPDQTQALDHQITPDIQALPVSDLGSIPSCETQYRVENYGAVGDGTTDDTSAIQKALNSLSTICFSKTYKISKTLRIDNANTKTLLGGGKLIASSSVGVMLEIQGNNVIITDLEFDGKDQAFTGIKVLQNSNNVRFDSIEVHHIYAENGEKNGLGISIAGDNVNHLTINDSYIHHINGYENGQQWDSQGANRGIYVGYSVGTTSTYIKIDKCHFDQIKGFEDGDAIQFQSRLETGNVYRSYTGSSITNSVFDNCPKRAIKIQAGGVTIANNKINASWTDENQTTLNGIELFGENNTVTGNVIAVERMMLGISVTGDHNTISNNTITISPINHFTTCRGSQVYGMKNSGKYNTFDKNIVTTWQNAYIEAKYTLTNGTVLYPGNNTIKNNTFNYGISQFKYSTGSAFNNNAIKGYKSGSSYLTMYGVYIDANSSKLIFSSNSISSVQKGLIFAGSSKSSSTISGNNFSDIRDANIEP